jgi:hypothetical protein
MAVAQRKKDNPYRARVGGDPEGVIVKNGRAAESRETAIGNPGT